MPAKYQSRISAAGASIENGSNAGPRPLSTATVTITMVAAIFAVSVMSVLTGLT